MKSFVALFTGSGIALSLFAASLAHADIVCEGETSLGTHLKLTIADSGDAHLLVTDEDEKIRVDRLIPNVSGVWDGHKTGLITAPGLSMKYENHYGCIRNAVITTDIRGGGNSGGIGLISTIGVWTCRGGQTPDSVCLPRPNRR